MHLFKVSQQGLLKNLHIFCLLYILLKRKKAIWKIFLSYLYEFLLYASSS